VPELAEQVLRPAEFLEQSVLPEQTVEQVLPEQTCLS